jgi:hypothetical protein
MLEIQAVRGDTGIALAVYSGKSLAPGAYPVTEPEKAESVTPAAAVAVRWPTKTQVQGFRGDSGQITLQRSSSGRFSGSMKARARSVVDTQRITLSGSFSDLLVQPDSVGCAAKDSLPNPLPEVSDTGVH